MLPLPKNRKSRRARGRNSKQKGIIVDIAKGVESALYGATGSPVFAPSSKSLLQRRTRSRRAPRTERVSAPLANSSVWRNSRPSAAGQTIRIRRTELVDVNIGQADDLFDAQTMAINPGNSLAFPWLHNIARKYEMFRFHKLSYTYHGQCTTTSEMRVAIAFDPDFTDPVPASMVECQQVAGAVGFAAWTPSVSMNVDSMYLGASGTNAKFVQETDGESSDYNRTLGHLHVCTQGSTEQNVGILQVTYDVELSVPQLHETSAPLYGHLRNMDVSTVSTYLTDAFQLGGNLASRGWSWSGTTIHVPSYSSGNYFLAAAFSSDNASGCQVASASASVTGGVSLHNNFIDNSGTGDSKLNSGLADNTKASMLILDFHVTDEAGTLNLRTLNSATSTTYMDLFIFSFVSGHTGERKKRAKMSSRGLPVPPRLRAALARAFITRRTPPSPGVSFPPSVVDLTTPGAHAAPLDGVSRGPQSPRPPTPRPHHGFVQVPSSTSYSHNPNAQAPRR